MPNGATAQQSGVQSVSQIVTIDRQRLFSETVYGQRVVATVEVERARLAQKAREAEADLAQEEKLLTDQRGSMDPTAFRVLADAFDRKVNELRAEGQQREQEFVSVLEREQSAFFERIGPILGRMVRELGAVVILDRRAILLATRNIDITEMAIRRIDLELGDGVTNPTEPSDNSTDDEAPAAPDGQPDTITPEDASNN
ncbi:OmpH family outer membrane protein [Aliiroseovarius pelagivivens]|nr:OmpH family outer membrane protein [Aliiroseovarius pelagivivens]